MTWFELVKATDWTSPYKRGDTPPHNEDYRWGKKRWEEKLEANPDINRAINDAKTHTPEIIEEQIAGDQKEHDQVMWLPPEEWRKEGSPSNKMNQATKADFKFFLSEEEYNQYLEVLESFPAWYFTNIAYTNKWLLSTSYTKNDRFPELFTNIESNNKYRELIKKVLYRKQVWSEQ